MEHYFNEKFRVDGRRLGHGEPCFIIAEGGVNHNGSLSIAKQIVDAACDAEADAIKFQTFVTGNLVSKSLSAKQYDMLKKLELQKESFLELKDYAKSKRIIFFSTPFDEQSVDILRQLKMPLYKISSGDLNNIPLLKTVARIGKPMIISTGMSTMLEVHEALDAVKHQCHDLILTHCVSLYPPLLEEVNLRAMDLMKEIFHVPVGYSDHTLGTEICVAAVAMGACAIEKHLTLNKKMVGPDHKASLDGSEFISLVKQIRNVETALGERKKAPVSREFQMRRYARKSIVAVKDIAKDKSITANDIAPLRPGTGIEPKYYDKIIGRRTKTRIRAGHQISWHLLQ